jgi:hypothetical protein
MNRSATGLTILRLTLAASMLLFSVCKLDLGEQPVGASPDNTSVTGSSSAVLTVTAGRGQIRGDGDDSTTITATLKNLNNNFIAGDTINFMTTKGGIASWAVTNTNGKAEAVLYGAVFNGRCTVTVVSKKYHAADTCFVTFTGINIKLQANIPSAKVNDPITITATVTDLLDHPMVGQTVSFSTTNGMFTGNVSALQVQTLATGQASVTVTASAKNTVTVIANVNGTVDSVSLSFVDTVSVFSGTRNFSLYSSKTQLKADNSDVATIIAELKDENNNPAVGDSVLFRSTIGTIGAMAVVDSSGRAQVTLRSQRVNGRCVIMAIAPKSKDTASTIVTFSGIKVHLESDVMDLKINDPATITAILSDASGNPFGGDSVILTAKGGTFLNNLASISLTFDPNGRATVKFTSTTAGTAMVYAEALKSSDSIGIIFTNNALGLTASKTDVVVGGSDFTTLTATYVDGSNQPKAGVPITFSTNAGTITTATVNTNAAGQAQTTLQSAAFAGVATVVASAAAGNALIKINFLASVPKKVKLTVSPDNIGVNGGVATMTAIVTDTNGNMVTGADVNFRILKGPGGGEYIDKPVVTSQNGIAHAQLLAGSIPSQYRSCLVSATIGSIADSSKLTISGEPYAISVARPQSDTIVVPKAGVLNDATFDFNAGAVVVDINGNPVADGTRVNFSVVVSGMALHPRYFVRWSGLGSADEKKAVMAYGFIDVPFEDINNNFKMDENDLKLDYNDAVAARGDDVNGDGVCDFNPAIHDLWYDFNGNGKVDAGSTRVPTTVTRPITRELTDTICKDSVIITTPTTTPDTLRKDTVIVVCHEFIRLDTTGYKLDTVGFTTSYTGAEPSIIVDGTRIWADLYPNGVWDTTELVRDVGTKNVYDAPASGDRRWWEYECLPFWSGVRFDFDKNDFGVAINTSATCVGGVADVHVTYPRQLARRLIVTVNAEANGVRDRNGERFVLPVIVGQ